MKRQPSPPDTACRRCDDSGLVPRLDGWEPCTCSAGAVVLDQIAEREERGTVH